MIGSASSSVVLIVEDEAIIRMGAAALIEDLGCEFFEASSADEAIALLEQHPQITILFTDIQMAGSKVTAITPTGELRSMTLLEARLLELASPTCRRRLICEDFIRLVRQAVTLRPEDFNGRLIVADIEKIRENLR